MITVAFEKAFERMAIQEWPFIYISVDLHETICHGHHYSGQQIKFYPYTIDCLQFLLKHPLFKVGLYTCTRDEYLKPYFDALKVEGVIFDYINDSPVTEPTALASFEKKPYFNVLVDDKAGFDATVEWEVLLFYLMSKTQLYDLAQQMKGIE